METTRSIQQFDFLIERHQNFLFLVEYGQIIPIVFIDAVAKSRHYGSVTEINVQDNEAVFN